MPRYANDTPILPEKQHLEPGAPFHPQAHTPRPGGGRFRRFMRGYFILVGVLTTLYVLVQLLVVLFVEIGKWAPIG